MQSIAKSQLGRSYSQKKFIYSKGIVCGKSTKKRCTNWVIEVTVFRFNLAPMVTGISFGTILLDLPLQRIPKERNFLNKSIGRNT